MTSSGPQLRVVSLLPSCTELVCALGLESLLVGRSHECDFPPTVKALPACTTSRINDTASSAAIDREVKQRLHDALSLYDVNLPLLQSLRPDVILTQAQCEVCAVSLPQVEAALTGQDGWQPRLISLAPKRFPDLWTNVLEVADALGVDEQGRKVVRELKGRVGDVIAKVVEVEARPTVACLEWFDPLMAAGNWVPEMVELAGGSSLYAKPGRHSPWLEWKTLMQGDPEMLLLMPCGFGLSRTRQEAAALTSHNGWTKLRAVRDGRVFLTDGSAYFNRPGPRLVNSLEILAEILHPALFPMPRHAGDGWQRLG